MKVVYGVPWIEVEFGWGERPEGYLLFLDKEQCIKKTQEDSATGPYDGGYYCGPVRPLYYVEIPFDSLEDSLKERLSKFQNVFSPNTWKPRFAGAKIPISY